MTTPSRRDPLAGTERLLLDGTNLLHAIRRGRMPAPPATLVGRLRAMIEPDIRIELVFDGPPERGLGNTRVASGVSVRYSGRISADALLGRLVAEALDPATLLVVTDDAELSAEVRRQGGRTARNAWLLARLSRVHLAAPSVGRRRPATPPRANSGAAGTGGGDDDQDTGRGWRPGRGATAKKGNPRRQPRRRNGRPPA